MISKKTDIAASFLALIIMISSMGIAAAQSGKISFNTDRDGNFEIYVMDDDGNNKMNVTQHPSDDFMSAISPDGSTIAFVSNRTGRTEVFTMSIDGTNLKQLTTGITGNGSQDIVGLDWHPDGTKLLLGARRDDPQRIVKLYEISSADGSGFTVLTQGPLDAQWARYSLDGTKIYMQRTTPFNGFTSEIYVSDADGKTNMTRLTFSATGSSSGGASRHPAEIIHNGVKKVIFTRDQAFRLQQTYIMNTDGSAQQNITNNSVSDAMAVSARGIENVLVFNSFRGNVVNVWKMNVDGSELLQLTTDLGSQPSWWAGNGGTTPPTLGLVAYYPFDGNANDESGNGNNGTASGATLTTDRFGNGCSAFSFDGVDDVVDFGNSPVFDISGSIDIWSLAVWVKYNAGESSHFLNKSTAGSDGWNACIIDGRVVGRLNEGGASGGTNSFNIATDDRFGDNNWHFVYIEWNAAEAEANSIKISVDGVFRSTSRIAGRYAPGKNYNNSGPLLAGLTPVPSDQYTGSLDDIRIFNRGLSNFEIQALFNEQPAAGDHCPNLFPIADAGSDQNVECTSPQGSPVTLDGTTSSDPDNDPLTYTWRENGAIIAGPTTSPTSQVTLGSGSHTIELTVDDGNGGTDTDEAIIQVQDTTPPELTVAIVPVTTVEGDEDSDDYEEDEVDEIDNKLFEIVCQATDICDANPVVSAFVETPSLAGLVQKFKTRSATKIKFDLKKREVTFEGPDPQSLLAGLQVVGGFGVVNGQVVKLKPHDEKKPPEEARWEFKLKESGIWEIKAPQFVLHCEGVDASSNVATATATPTFENDEDESISKILATRTSETNPGGFGLRQNYPNPFNPETRIQYHLPQSSHVKLEVFNMRGQKIRTLISGTKPAGSYSVIWNGRTDAGEAAPSGIYVYTLKAGGSQQSRKLLLLK